MERTAELDHYGDLITDLIIAAGRATSVEQFGAIREELRAAFMDMFALLSHDSLQTRDIVEDLMGAIASLPMAREVAC